MMPVGLRTATTRLAGVMWTPCAGALGPRYRTDLYAVLGYPHVAVTRRVPSKLPSDLFPPAMTNAYEAQNPPTARATFRDGVRSEDLTTRGPGRVGLRGGLIRRKILWLSHYPRALESFSGWRYRMAVEQRVTGNPGDDITGNTRR